LYGIIFYAIVQYIEMDMKKEIIKKIAVKKTMQSKKLIGLLGGMGPQSSVFIYQRIIEMATDRFNAVNNSDFPNIIIHNIPVPDFISSTSQKNEAKKIIIKSIKDLEKIKVTKFAIACNTVHLLLPDFQKATKIPFISMIDLVVVQSLLLGAKKVGLLASPTTLKTKLYEEPLLAKGIKVVKPSKKDYQLLNNIIRIILSGKSLPNDIKNKYINLVKSFLDKKVDLIILGCTELPLALNYLETFKDNEIKFISCVDILSNGLLSYYYDDK
jgi:aspartate racemase